MKSNKERQTEFRSRQKKVVIEVLGWKIEITARKIMRIGNKKRVKPSEGE